MKVSLILAVVSMMVAVDMSYATCTQSLKDDCKSTFQSSLYPSIGIKEGCRVFDTYLDCLLPCGDPDSLKKIGYEFLSDKGIECGSAMVTLSGTMMMLMLFTTLRHFF